MLSRKRLFCNITQNRYMYFLYSDTLVVAAAMNVGWMSVMVITVMVSVMVAAFVSTVVGTVTMVPACMSTIVAVFLGAVRLATTFVIPIFHLQRHIYTWR